MKFASGSLSSLKPARVRGLGRSYVAREALKAGQGSRVAKSAYVPAGRALHLVDFENLSGGPFATAAQMQSASVRFRRLAEVRRGDHVCVAVNPELVFEAKAHFSEARILSRRGKDGADLALLEHASNNRWVASRFDRVVIGSGDGIFEDKALALRSLGVTVGVIGRVGGTAQGLRRVATYVREIGSGDRTYAAC